MAISFTQTDLDNLLAAFASGALEVKIGDRSVRYNSVDDLLKQIKFVSGVINSAAGVPEIKSSLAGFSRV